MSIEWWRDLVIVIFGIGATILVCVSIILMFVCYARVKPILKSVTATMRKIEDITTCVEEGLIEPLSRAAAFVQGIRQAASMMGRFSKKKEGKGDG